MVEWGVVDRGVRIVGDAAVRMRYHQDSHWKVFTACPLGFDAREFTFTSSASIRHFPLPTVVCVLLRCRRWWCLMHNPKSKRVPYRASRRRVGACDGRRSSRRAGSACAPRSSRAWRRGRCRAGQVRAKRVFRVRRRRGHAPAPLAADAGYLGRRQHE